MPAFLLKPPLIVPSPELGKGLVLKISNINK